jgi:hypothetical protein
MLKQANHRGLEAAEGALLNLISDRRDEELLAAARRWLVAIDGPPSVFQSAHLELEQARNSGRDFFGSGLRTSMGLCEKWVGAWDFVLRIANIKRSGGFSA